MSETETAPRFIPPGSCSWCGHKPHTTACSAEIRTSTKGDTGPCPCRRHELQRSR